MRYMLIIVCLSLLFVPASYGGVKEEKQFISRCYAEGLSNYDCKDIRAIALKSFIAKGKEDLSEISDLCYSVCRVGNEDRKTGQNRLKGILRTYDDVSKKLNNQQCRISLKS